MDGLVKASAGILSCLIAIDAPRPVQRLSWTAAASLQPLFWWLMVNNFLLLPLVCCLSSGMFYRQQLLSFGSRWLAPRIIVWQQMLSIIYRITRTRLWYLFCFIGKKIPSEMEVALLLKEHLGTSRNIWEQGPSVKLVSHINGSFSKKILVNFFLCE